MNLSERVTPELIQAAGVWVGLAVSLSLLSLIWREQWLSRLVQHILVGATAGWVLVLVWHTLLQPRIVTPWLQGEFTSGNTVPVVLSLILFLGAFAPRPRKADAHILDRSLKEMASLVSAFLVAAALATGLIGIWQGTVIPQVLTGVTTAYWLPIALLLTLIVFLYKTVRPSHLNDLSPYLTSGLQFFIRLGHPLLMLASGMVLARLIASRITLLTVFLENNRRALQDSGLLDWVQTFLP